MGALKTIDAELYRPGPDKTLYHYTSLSGMLGIAEDKTLRATEIQYVNDAAELGHFGELLNNAMIQRAGGSPSKVLSQFREWLSDRLTDGHMVFVGCFTEQGNLLSQWRGYSPPGRGVSLGFDPQKLTLSAATQRFRIGRCIYDRGRKQRLAELVLATVEKYALDCGEAPPAIRHPDQSYHSSFYEIEAELLSIAALVKNESFFEETEWRAVSPAIENYAVSPIRYRSGVSTLIPFLDLPLPQEGGKLALTNVLVGPTPTLKASQAAVAKYLSRYAACPRVGSSMIPFREC